MNVSQTRDLIPYPSGLPTEKQVQLMRNLRYKAPPFRSRTNAFQRMSPEERVNLALELTSSITSITLEGIKNQNPRISTQQLLKEARRRFQTGRRTR